MIGVDDDRLASRVAAVCGATNAAPNLTFCNRARQQSDSDIRAKGFMVMTERIDVVVMIIWCDGPPPRTVRMVLKIMRLNKTRWIFDLLVFFC